MEWSFQFAQNGPFRKRKGTGFPGINQQNVCTAALASNVSYLGVFYVLYWQRTPLRCKISIFGPIGSSSWFTSVGHNGICSRKGFSFGGGAAGREMMCKTKPRKIKENFGVSQGGKAINRNAFNLLSLSHDTPQQRGFCGANRGKIGGRLLLQVLNDMLLREILNRTTATSKSWNKTQFCPPPPSLKFSSKKKYE